MDGSRVLRAVVTVLTLLVCLWALSRIKTSKPTAEAPEEKKPIAASAAVKPSSYEPVEVVPPLEVNALPFFAQDNTCEQSDTMDLSACTKTLSGSAVRVYRVRVSANEPLFISVEPQSEYFDPGIAVVDADHHCMGGADDQGAGLVETLLLNHLAEGVYQVIVSGYHDDCGPYQLTLRKESPPIAQVERLWKHCGPNGTVISWQTFAEVDLSHFVLYRIEGDSRVQIGSVRKHGSSAGWSTYHMIDRDLDPNVHYVVEAVARDGRTESFSS